MKLVLRGGGRKEQFGRHSGGFSSLNQQEKRQRVRIQRTLMMHKLNKCMFVCENIKQGRMWQVQ